MTCLNHFKISHEMEEVFEWKKWSKQIPFIPFNVDWLVQITPPFTGAVIRFRVKLKDKPNSDVSIYLDCYDNLGYFGSPYWEVYPVDGDCDRCAMNEVDELISMITKSLEQA